MPRYSVIIASYNRAGYIGAAIDSVLQQTLRDFEIIVCDDGSTDNTATVLAAYGDQIRVVHANRKGPGGARNAGIRAAKGEFISCLDSDDLWAPSTLTSIDQTVRACEGRVAVYLRPVFFKDGQQVAPLILESPFAYRVYDSYFDTPAKTQCGASQIGSIPRSAFDEAGYFIEGMVNAEDRDLTLRMGRILKFAMIDAPSTILYREHQGQVSIDMERNLRGWRTIAENARRGDYGQLSGNVRATAKMIQTLMEYAIAAPQLSGMWWQGILFYRQVMRMALSCREFMMGPHDADYSARYPMLQKSRHAWRRFAFYYPAILLLTMVSRQTHKNSDALVDRIRTAEWSPTS